MKISEAKVKVKKENLVIRFFKKLGFLKTLILIVILILVFIFAKGSLLEMFHNSTNKIDTTYIKNNNLYINDEMIGKNIYDVSYANEENISFDTQNKISAFNFNPFYSKEKKLSIYYQNYNIDTKKTDIKIDGIKDNFVNSVVKNAVFGSLNITKNFDKIFYLKNTDDNITNLYENDFTTETLIDENVKEYYFNDLDDTIYYEKNDNIYSIKNENKNLISTSSEIIKDELNSENFNEVLKINHFDKILYKKYNDTSKKAFDIYKYVNSESSKIVEDAVDKVIYYYNDDFLYFYKQKTEDMIIKDFIDDDISDGRYTVNEPLLENYRDDFFGGLFPDYFSYMQDKMEYDNFVNYMNNNQDEIDKYIKQIDKGIFKNNSYVLYSYDGQVEDKLSTLKVQGLQAAKNISSYVFFEGAIDEEIKEIEKVKLSTIIQSNASVSSYMRSLNRDNNFNKYLYHKKEGMRLINLDAFDTIYIDDVYVYKLKNKFLLKIVNKQNQYLYTFDYEKNSLVNAKLINQFLTNDIVIYDNKESDDIYYEVLYGNNNSYLYKNEEMIEKKIVSRKVLYATKSNKIYYITDADLFDANVGKLKFYQNGKTKQVAENVLISSIKIKEDTRDIYYIADYNKVALTGKLYRADDFGRTHFINDDVSNVFVYNERDTLKSKDLSSTEVSVAGESFGENNYQEF